MTQTELDEIVLSIAEKEIERGLIVISLRRQGDPKAREMEESHMMLSNIISALRDYDIDSTLLSQDNIDYMVELATIIIHTKP